MSKEFVIPKGTVCKHGGFPFELAEDTKVIAGSDLNNCPERAICVSNAFKTAFASKPKVSKLISERIFGAILKQVSAGHSLEGYDPLESAKRLEAAAIYLGFSEAQK